MSDDLCVYSICGTLHSVDQFLNIKLTDISITDPDKYPHMVCVCHWFLSWHQCSQARFHIGAVDNCTQTLTLPPPPLWHETLFDELKASAYRCKQERSVTFKICQNAFLAWGSPDHIREVHDAPQTPYQLRGNSPTFDAWHLVPQFVGHCSQILLEPVLGCSICWTSQAWALLT